MAESSTSYTNEDGVSQTSSSTRRKTLTETLQDIQHNFRGLRLDKTVWHDAIKVNSEDPSDTQDETHLPWTHLSLYGRSSEKRKLKDALNQLVEEDCMQFCLIDGLAGTGKTSLAMALRDPVREKQGIFVQGRYDFSLREDPYFAITTALNDLCNEALKKLSVSEMSRLRGILRQSLDSLDIQLLISIVPLVSELCPLIEAEVVALHCIKLEDKQTRVHLAVSNFLRLMSNELALIAIVLDDCQWADAASFDLLHTIAVHPEKSKIMIIACYRSGVPFQNERLRATVDGIRKKAQGREIQFTELSVSNISLEDTQQMLLDLLPSSDMAAISALGNLCMSQTLGNPFHLLNFISLLQETNLIHLEESGNWSWDLEKIRTSTAATKSVSDLVRDRIKRAYKREIIHLLLYCACLGNVFDKDVITLVWREAPGNEDKSDEQLEDLLAKAVDHLLLESVGTSQFRFRHNAVKEAAISMISKQKFSYLQFNVGAVLVNGFVGLDSGYPENPKMVFVVANLLNNNQGSVDAGVAQLNLAAAIRAKELSAFSSAAAYAMEGIKRLPKDWPREHLQLAIDLHSIGAEAERCVGNIIQSKLHCEAILNRKDVSLIQKMSCHRVLINILEQDEQFGDSLDSSLQVLDSLGVKLPRKSLIQKLQAVSALAQTKSSKFLPDSKRVDNLVVMTDPLKCEAMELMDLASSSAYFSGNRILVFLLCVKRIRFTYEYGLHASSPTAFAILAGTLMHAFGDWERGKQLAELSLATLEKLKSLGADVVDSKCLCRVHFFISTWTVSPRLMEDPLIKTYKSGMFHGDTDSATKTLAWLVNVRLVSGINLRRVEDDCREHVMKIESLKYFKWAECYRLAWQTILNLLTPQKKTIYLNGIGINEATFLKSNSDSEGRLHLVHFYRRFLCTFYGEFEKGARDAIKYGEKFAKVYPGAYFGIDFFHRAMCLYGTSRITKQTKFWKLAEKLRIEIASWVGKEAGAPNHVHLLSILDAEHVALAEPKNITKISKFYETAVAVSLKDGFIQNAALASERFFDYLKHMNREQDAQAQLLRSISLYAEWGALGKVDQMKEKHAGLLQSHSIKS